MLVMRGFSLELGSARTRRRLIILIFSIAAVLLVLSMVMVFFVGRTSLDAQREMAKDLEVISNLQRLESNVKDAETGQRGYLLTGEEGYLQPYNDSLAELKRDTAALQRLVSSDKLFKDDLSRTSDLIQQKLEELARTIQLRREVGLAAALAEVHTDRGKDIMDRVRNSIGRMISIAQANYDGAIYVSRVTIFWRSATFGVVMFLNLGFLAWAYRVIARQDWFQSGQARLNEQLAGELHLKELGDNALRFFAEYLDAQAGAIFIEEDGCFHQFATYAVPAANSVPQSFSAGEGLLGQAVKDKRSFLVRDVPEGYLAIGSALGRHRPKALVVAPMKVDNKVNAVIELGFFHLTSEICLDFLERVGEVVAVAVRSAKYRTQLQQSLEETQRQAQELQAQSEELRVTNEELEEQGRALKESQSRLEQQQTELEQTNYQLSEQSQVLEAQKDTLSQSKLQLEAQAAIVEQASRYKTDFLANMSHELRTPLNSSLILAKLLADNREGNLSLEQVKYAKTIESAGNDLLALINDVLDLAKVEAGRMDMKAESFPVSDVLDSLRGMFEALAANKGLALRMTIAPNAPPTMETDRRRLEQVLKNLLSNAVKFTERGEVSVEVAPAAGNYIAFAVRDTGIGIKDDQQQIVFEPFCQADGATNRKFGGTGLGLSISRELVRLMGGTLKLSSELGKGSVFTVTLPVVYKGSAASSRRVPSPEPPGGADGGGRPPRAGETRRSKPAIPDDRAVLAGNRRTILIVEDDPAFATILIDLARELNFQGLVAQGAEEAISLAQQFQPSAAILDIGLPDNSGMHVLERLKADSRTRHIPVHVVSGGDYSEPALAMGAVGYMLKPVKREQLVEAFQKLESRLAQKLRRVLVVEDDDVQLESLEKLLCSRDVEAVGVRTVADCLEKLKDSTFDCMVLDLSLPDASGFSLLETVSAGEHYSFPPVIIYTGRDLSLEEEQRLRKYSKSIIIKGAKSPERLLDEVTLFLHQIVAQLPPEQQRMLDKARNREAAMEGRRILVVEDDVRNIFALTSVLEPKGVRVQIARNGLEALRVLQGAAENPANRIDLVLMDIMMPEMNGLEAMREIRKNSQWQDLPIIALTAKARKDDQQDCLLAGASDYLAKPLDVEKLLSLIRVWMPR